MKKKFDSMCDAFGLSHSAAINIFMKTVVRERRIPFEIKAESEVEVRMADRYFAVTPREMVEIINGNKGCWPSVISPQQESSC